MTLVRAITQIDRNPTGKMEAKGEFDALGNVIVRAMRETHAPGDFLELDGSELKWMLDNEAVIIASPEEVAKNAVGHAL